MKRITLKTKDKNGISYQDKIDFMVRCMDYPKNMTLKNLEKGWTTEDDLDGLLEGMSTYKLLSKEGERLYAMFLKKIYK